MDVTLLGSGDALGVPVPLCDCEYCAESPRRRRPGLLVETDETTLLFDAGPDLPAQLRETGVTGLDAVFLTHHHYDHVAGVKELDHAVMEPSAHLDNPEAFDRLPPHSSVALYATPVAATHLTYRAGGAKTRLDPEPLGHGDPVTVGSFRVVPFPVKHARPAFDTVGFAVTDGSRRVVYAPDLREFAPGRPAGHLFTDADLLVAEGSGLFRADPHGSESALRASLSRADADRTVLVNLNEHLHRRSTDELRATASDAGYELGSDFASYTL